LILDTNALSAYLDSTPEAVEIVSGARELAIPVIVAGEFAGGVRHYCTVSRTPVCVETPPMVATTAASPLGRLLGTVTLN